MVASNLVFSPAAFGSIRMLFLVACGSAGIEAQGNGSFLSGEKEDQATMWNGNVYSPLWI
jgi:hypothetical protein